MIDADLNSLRLGQQQHDQDLHKSAPDCVLELKEVDTCPNPPPLLLWFSVAVSVYCQKKKFSWQGVKLKKPCGLMINCKPIQISLYFNFPFNKLNHNHDLCSPHSHKQEKTRHKNVYVEVFFTELSRISNGNKIGTRKINGNCLHCDF